MTPPADQTAAPSRLGAWWLVMVGLVLGVVAGGLKHPLWATAIFSASCLAAAVLRAVLPKQTAGALVVRRAWIDVTVLAALGLAVGIIGRSMNLHPHV